MKRAWTAAMHAVLDGEASAAEREALHRALAGDPALRAEFEALSRLFEALDALPPAHPPEGLVAATTAAWAARRAANEDQLFSGRRVFVGPASHATRSTTIERSPQMSQHTERFFARPKFWIGAGIAAAAVIAVAQYGFDFPPRGEDVMGTIVPAQRYRAPQAGAEDVKPGIAPATAPVQSTAVDVSAQQGADATARSAARASAQMAAQGTAQMAAESSARMAAEGAAKSAAADAAAKATAAGAAKMATQAAAKSAAESAADAAVNAAANVAAEGAAKVAAQHAAEAAAANAAKAATR
ncbi:MAG: anti-sigma factor family protein [Betaproteobacteria bacterium]